MTNKSKTLLFASLIGEAISGFTAAYAAATEDKKKWVITNDFMMIIGKYFEDNKDYINVMKVNKKYKQLVLMYHFNPISDISLFENIQTQHFYNKEDVKYKTNGMFQYVYWMSPKYAGISPNAANEIFKYISLNRENCNQLSFIEGNKCTISNKVDLIEKESFQSRKDITDIILSHSLKEIEDNAFAKMDIKSLIIPATLKTVGENVFYRSKLENTYIYIDVLQKKASQELKDIVAMWRKKYEFGEQSDEEEIFCLWASDYKNFIFWKEAYNKWMKSIGSAK